MRIIHELCACVSELRDGKWMWDVGVHKQEWSQGNGTGEEGGVTELDRT